MKNCVLAELPVMKTLCIIKLYILFPNYAHSLLYSLSINAYGDLHTIKITLDR